MKISTNIEIELGERISAAHLEKTIFKASLESSQGIIWCKSVKVKGDVVAFVALVARK